jgi:hypothetical protein
MKNILSKELEILFNTELGKGLPYEDIEQIENDFKDVEEWLVADFNEFVMLVAGSCTYVLSNKKIPKYQKQFLYRDFFSLYPKYLFIKDSVSSYPEFHRQLLSVEKAREIILDIIKL